MKAPVVKCACLGLGFRVTVLGNTRFCGCRSWLLILFSLLFRGSCRYACYRSRLLPGIGGSVGIRGMLVFVVIIVFLWFNSLAIWRKFTSASLSMADQRKAYVPNPKLSGLAMLAHSAAKLGWKAGSHSGKNFIEGSGCMISRH